MLAAVLHALGERPRAENFPEPVPGDGEALLTVSAAAVKPVDKQLAAGAHYASSAELPVVCGSDGVGKLQDGTRVFFGGPRKPFGAMAERTVVPRRQCFAIPESLDDATAAAVPNPGLSAWLSLKHRAKLVAGETVLILGATGVTGTLAVQIAKILGAGRVVAAGRNATRLDALRELGADATILLDRPARELIEAFRAEVGKKRFDVIVDYLWGKPTEALLAALAENEFRNAGSDIRLLEVGESAGPTVTLPASALRSTPLTILGTAGIPSWEALTEAFEQVMARAARGELRIVTEQVPLGQIASAWDRAAPGRRLVVMP